MSAPPWRLWIGWLVRIGVTVAAFAWIFHLVDLEQLWTALRRTDLGWFALGCGLYLVAFLAACIRWFILVRITHRLPFLRILQWSLLGAFFNTLLPTTIGGDVVRMQEAGVVIGHARAAASIALDRLSGFLAMFAIGLGATIAALPHLKHPLILQGIAGLIAVFIVAIWGLVHERFFRALIAPLSWLRITRWHAALMDFYTVLHSYRRTPRAVGAALTLSGITQGCSMIVYWVTAIAMGLSIPFWAILVFVPVLMLIAALPFTLNGLGLREGAAILLLGSIGVPEAEALGLSLLCAAIPAFSGMVGGLVFLGYRRQGLLTRGS